MSEQKKLYAHKYQQWLFKWQFKKFWAAVKLYFQLTYKRPKSLALTSHPISSTVIDILSCS